MHCKKTLIALFVIAASTLAAFQWIFTVPEQAQLLNIVPSTKVVQRCYQESYRKEDGLDVNGELSILVWNIYKQQQDDWFDELSRLSRQTQLVLLQEASITPTLKQFISGSPFTAKSVRAFDAFDTSTGVLNLSTSPPTSICAYIEVEPWLMLPKSALLAYYALSNGEVLAVVNIHAINFTFGTQEYQQQLKQLSQQLSGHLGPMIIAGDFNSWSERRLLKLKQSMQELNLVEVHFTPDHRRQFIINDIALDHVFYRGLMLKTAEAPLTDASDHNPMMVTFTVNRD